MIRGLLSSVVISIAGLAYDPPASLPSDMVQLAATSQNSDLWITTVAADPESDAAYIHLVRPKASAPVYLMRFAPLVFSGFLAVWALFALARQSDDGENTK